LSIAARHLRASAKLVNDFRIFFPSRFAYAAASKLGEQSHASRLRDPQDRECRILMPSGTFLGSLPTAISTLQLNAPPRPGSARTLSGKLRNQRDG
jgi:hypothetical protein